MRTPAVRSGTGATGLEPATSGVTADDGALADKFTRALGVSEPDAVALAVERAS